MSSPSDEPVARYTRILPHSPVWEQLLVTVYGDGEATIAFRSDESERWGPEYPMRREEGGVANEPNNEASPRSAEQTETDSLRAGRAEEVDNESG